MATNPDPKPKPSPGSAAGSSTGSSAADDVYADAGPAFDADAPPPAAAVAEPDDDRLLDASWSVERVKTLLTAKGVVLHGLVAVEPDSTEWVYTDDDLRAIAPPLTNILNRYDATRAAAAASDELAVAVGFTGYVVRSYGERRAALAELDPTEPEPVSGVRAPEGSGPPPEPAPDPAPASEADVIPPIRGNR